MSISRDYEVDVVRVAPEATCVDVADAMDAHTVGCVLVVMDDAPVGIITDRDLVCRVVAADRDPEKTTAAEVMSGNLVTGVLAADLSEQLGLMRDRSVRRLPLLDDGKLAGIVTLDDVVVQLSSYLFNANRGILGALHESHRTARRRRRLEVRDDALEEIRAQLIGVGDQTRARMMQQLQELVDRFGGPG